MECQERVDARRESPSHFTAAIPARRPNACPLENPSYAPRGLLEGSTEAGSTRPLTIFFGFEFRPLEPKSDGC